MLKDVKSADSDTVFDDLSLEHDEGPFYLTGNWCVEAPQEGQILQVSKTEVLASYGE
jgi:hypothetical protein